MSSIRGTAPSKHKSISPIPIWSSCASRAIGIDVPDAYSLLHHPSQLRSIPISEPSVAPDGVHAILARVAARLQCTLVDYSESIAEPTDHGYLRGYQLDLRNATGQAERRLVFVEPGRSAAISPDVLTIPVDGTNDVVAVWLYPSDPALPALRTLTDVASASVVLAALGIRATAAAVNVVSYRPGRRAVVRVDSESEHVFLKVVEPGKAEAISERHELFRSSGLPVPRLLGWSADGVVGMSGLPGVEAQAAVGRIGDHGAFLDQLEFLCSLLEIVPAVNTARPSLFHRLDWYLERLTERLPGDAGRVAAVGAEIAAKGAEGYDFEFTPVTIHVDLHLGQLFVDTAVPSEISGILDIDTAGVGDPADDAGAFYAHLIALGESMGPRDRASAEECFRLARSWLTRWRRNRNAGFDARARAIAATHILGHALQPRAADPLAASRRLLERAHELVN
jgi:Phosphotransferase enzyme family